jgi:hypothetical protein
VLVCSHQALADPQAFIEPVLAVGELQETGFGSSGVGLLVVGVGYRMGIIF